MCFHYAMSENAKTLENRFKAQMDSKKFSPTYHANGFQHPEMPVITNSEPDKIKLFKWGLIPFWIKSIQKAKEISNFTLNARSDTIFEKASFKNSINRKRCLIPATGYFEWHHYKNKKYPFFIYESQLGELWYKKSQEREEENKEKFGFAIFSFAGIWETWKDENNIIVNTFSIITTKANSFVAKIHNTKKRMPVVLQKKDEDKWLDKKLSKAEISNILNFNNIELDAYPVNKNLGDSKINTNTSDILSKKRCSIFIKKENKIF